MFYRVTTTNTDDNTHTERHAISDDPAEIGRMLSGMCQQFDRSCRSESVENVEAHYTADGMIEFSLVMGTGKNGDRYQFEIARIENPSATDYYRATGEIGEWTITVEPGTERTDYGASPCNYRVHALKPGTYPLTFKNTGGSDWSPDEITPGYIATIAPDHAVAAIPSVVTIDHYENRIGAHSQARHEEPNEPATYTTRHYAYTVTDGDTFNGITFNRQAN